MRKRRNHDCGLKARAALEAVKSKRTVSNLAAAYGVHPTMILQWSEPQVATDGVDGPANGIVVCQGGPLQQPHEGGHP